MLQDLGSIPTHRKLVNLVNLIQLSSLRQQHKQRKPCAFQITHANRDCAWKLRSSSNYATKKTKTKKVLSFPWKQNFSFNMKRVENQLQSSWHRAKRKLFVSGQWIEKHLEWNQVEKIEVISRICARDDINCWGKCPENYIKRGNCPWKHKLDFD